MHEISGIFKAGKTYCVFLGGENLKKNDLWTSTLFQYAMFTHSVHRNSSFLEIIFMILAVAEFQESLSGAVR